MYHRLLSFKKLTTELAQTGSHRRLSPLGPELGLSLPVGVVDTGDNPAEHYYEYALELAEKMFDGDVDQQTYEEQLRYMGGIRAYPLFTIDKLISTVIKHVSRLDLSNRFHANETKLISTHCVNLDSHDQQRCEVSRYRCVVGERSSSTNNNTSTTDRLQNGS